MPGRSLQWRLHEASRRTLAFLARDQTPRGEFPTYASRHEDFTPRRRLPTCVYPTTFVLHTLARTRPTPAVRRMIHGGVRFLRSQQEAGGVWHYLGRGEQPYPCDLDDTSCAVAALAHLGIAPPRSFLSLLDTQQVAEGGPHATWIGVDDRSYPHLVGEVDSLVNANILHCVGRLGRSLPGTAAYLAEIVETGDYRRDNRYSLSPHFLIYAIARATAISRAPNLLAQRSRLVDHITDGMPPRRQRSAVELAFLAAALLYSEATPQHVIPYAEALLETQRDDGSWPIAAVNWGLLDERDSSPAMIAALALEVFGGLGGRTSKPRGG